jgi:outer membrane cobalamin receptor
VKKKASVKKLITRTLVMLLLISNCPAVFGQADSTEAPRNFYDLSLEQLMNLEVSVASIHSLTTRESPGIVTLITEEEIEASGARDLIDVLRMVPGLEFGVDVEGVVGLAVRGNWAHEGKALLLIDGIEMNENLFSTLQFGNHYPVGDIKKVEIIRGPGSAIYGGNAEYAVINIITHTAAERNGGKVKASYGQMASATGRKTIGVSTGNQFRKVGFTLSYFGSDAIRSDRKYSDLNGGTFNMAEDSRISSHYINGSVNYKTMQFRAIIDKYIVNSRDDYGLVTSKSYPVRFDSYIGELKQSIAVSKKLEITPKVNIKIHEPWNFNGTVNNDEVSIYDILSSRYTAGFLSSYDPTGKIKFSLGSEYFYDEAKKAGEEIFVATGNNKLTYNNAAIFAQGSFKSEIVNVTAGARYNWNDRYDNSFVPRISVTKAVKKFHCKLLYSQAYRAPNTENINLQPNIIPEHTTVVEVESGIIIGNNTSVTANVFDITTKDPIIYFYNDTSDIYLNSDETGTRGFELTFQWKYKQGYINIGYGYYSADSKNRLDEYIVPGKRHALLGIPNQKITCGALFRIKEKYSLSSTLIFSGVKYGVRSFDELGDPVIGTFDPYLLLNLTLRSEHFFVKGLSAGINANNILDRDDDYVQPYNGGHAALPGPSREFTISLTYHFLYR